MCRHNILVLGSSNTDLTVRVPSFPKSGESVIGNEFFVGAGGKGANQAVAAARLGGSVSLVCKVGRDRFGDDTIQAYKAEGLDTSLVLRSNYPTGVAVIGVDASGENRIMTAPGANQDFTAKDILALTDIVKKSDILLIQLEIPIIAVLTAAKLAAEAGVYVVLNSAPYSPVPEELFQYVDLFIPNEIELGAFSGIEVSDLDTAKEACLAMVAKGVKKIIVTLGAKGSMIYDGKEFMQIPAEAVEAVDSTAAGDTYCGALCVALSEGASLADAARFATHAASISVTRAGAQTSMPYRKEL